MHRNCTSAFARVFHLGEGASALLFEWVSSLMCRSYLPCGYCCGCACSLSLLTDEEEAARGKSP